MFVLFVLNVTIGADSVQLSLVQYVVPDLRLASFVLLVPLGAVFFVQFTKGASSAWLPPLLFSCGRNASLVSATPFASNRKLARRGGATIEPAMEERLPASPQLYTENVFGAILYFNCGLPV